jgi:hypothetical protein
MKVQNIKKEWLDRGLSVYLTFFFLSQLYSKEVRSKVLIEKEKKVKKRKREIF